MSVHVVRLHECPPQPWRNGGGSTRELLRWPPQAGGDDWTLRVSVAEIDRDGPFSSYAGIDRWFAVLDGAGVTLALPAGERALARCDAPVAFAGEQAPGCRLLDGPTRDLNLMLRRGACTGTMRLAQAGESFGDGGTAGNLWRALYAATVVRVQTGAASSETLAAGTLLWADADAAVRWQLREGGLAFWMSATR